MIGPYMKVSLYIILYYVKSMYICIFHYACTEVFKVRYEVSETFVSRVIRALLLVIL